MDTKIAPRLTTSELSGVALNAQHKAMQLKSKENLHSRDKETPGKWYVI